jgi:hypothetical protein
MSSKPLAGALVFVALLPLIPLAQAASFTVTTSGLSWSPNALEIAPGDSVTFTNGGGSHSWVRDDGTDSCSLPCTRTFSTATTIAYHCGVHPTTMKGTIQVGAGLTVAITSHVANATVAGLVAVSGTATHPSQAIQGVTLRFDNGAMVTATLGGSGTSVTWSASIDSLSLSEGAHELVARATAAGGLAKETRLPVIVDNPDRIDLRMTVVSAPAGSTSTTSTITFTMRNEGNTASPTVRMRAEYFYQGAWLLIAEKNVAGVISGGSRTDTIVWDPAGVLVGQFQIRVIADPNEMIPDIDRSNNVREGTAGWITSAVPGIDLTDPV